MSNCLFFWSSSFAIEIQSFYLMGRCDREMGHKRIMKRTWEVKEREKEKLGFFFWDVNRKISLFTFSCSSSSSPINFLLIFLKLVPKLLVFYSVFLKCLKLMNGECVLFDDETHFSLCYLWMRIFLKDVGCWFLVYLFSFTSLKLSWVFKNSLFFRWEKLQKVL